MAEPLRLLVVDDAPEHARMVEAFIRSGEAWPDADVRIAISYDAALRAFAGATFDVALFDYWLGARDGVGLLREVRRTGIDTPVVLLTGRGAEEVAVEAMKAGAADYLSKGSLTTEALESAIRHALALHAGELQRRHAEAALRFSEERFRALVENSSDALMLIDGESRITYLSPAWTRILGSAPNVTVGQSLFDVVHQDDRALVSARIAKALGDPLETILEQVRFPHADGSWRTLEAVGVNRLADPAVAGIVVNARDISERRRLEEQLRQAQQMEAVGQLAGGVAHEFNNTLTAILGYCGLLLEEVPDPSPLRQDLLEIQAAGDRAASLTRQLLVFSRRELLQPQVVDINGIVRQIEKLLRRLLTADVDLATVLAADLRSVTVDPTAVEQILVNLAVNARDAMPAGGRLTIETANVEVDAAYASAHVPMAPGPYVTVAVGDTGAGMDESARTRVFQPFFTVRQTGRGSGLGLATVYGVVKQCGGYVWVDSEPGRGTVFRVYLSPAAAPATAQRFPGAASDLAGWETILLVEDEDAVRALAREVLRRHGYVVLEARHGLDGLRVAERHLDDIHLLVTDVVMPRMGGRELAQRLGSVRPGMKTLFMSGYSDDAPTAEDLSQGTAYLSKPFTPDTFARHVRSMLDRRSS